MDGRVRRGSPHRAARSPSPAVGQPSERAEQLKLQTSSTESSNTGRVAPADEVPVNVTSSRAGQHRSGASPPPCASCSGSPPSGDRAHGSQRATASHLSASCRQKTAGRRTERAKRAGERTARGDCDVGSIPPPPPGGLPGPRPTRVRKQTVRSPRATGRRDSNRRHPPQRGGDGGPPPTSPGGEWCRGDDDDPLRERRGGSTPSDRLRAPPSPLCRACRS